MDVCMQFIHSWLLGPGSGCLVPIHGQGPVLQTQVQIAAATLQVHYRAAAAKLGRASALIFAVSVGAHRYPFSCQWAVAESQKEAVFCQSLHSGISPI